MNKRDFKKIVSGLNEATAILRGEAKPDSYRLTDPTGEWTERFQESRRKYLNGKRGKRSQ
jgi:hypothetical protein